MYKRPYKLINRIQNYAWGKKGNDSVIPSLAGVEADSNTPYAEFWIGTHPKLPSRIELNGDLVLLEEFIKSAPENILGKEVVENFGENLPYLLKILSIGKALSIQTHPDKAAACALNIIAPDKYPDDNHKPEIAIAFTELKALAGLKNKREIKKLLEDYPVFTSVLEGQPGVSLNNEEQFTDAERGTLYNSILFIETEKLEKVISQILKLIKEKSNPEYIEEVFLREFEEYGFDPGLLALFFFNLVHLKKGEAFFTPAGVPHAYLCGDIVECMATSDNVVRAGLTPKFKDIDTLVKILDTSYTAPNILQPEAKNMFGYKTPAEEFSLSRVLTQDSEQINLDTSGKIKTILLLSGKIILKTNGERFSYHNGDSFILPAEVGKYRMITTENTELFIVDIP